MTLSIEYRHGAWWLVTLDEPTNKVRTLALFTHEDAAYDFKRLYGLSMQFAHEVGRSGI